MQCVQRCDVLRVSQLGILWSGLHSVERTREEASSQARKNIKRNAPVISKIIGVPEEDIIKGNLGFLTKERGMVDKFPVWAAGFREKIASL